MTRERGIGWVLLAIAMVTVFMPVAEANGGSREQQTATVLALVLSIGMTLLVWRAMGRPERPAPAGYLGVAALIGSLMAMAGLQTAIINAIGFWLFTVGSRRAFPQETRMQAGSAVVLASVALLIWPSLLFQPEMLAHGVDDVQLQLRAGYRYWTIGTLILVAPFLALATLQGDWFERAFARTATAMGRITGRWFELALMALALALAVGISIYSFDRRPTTADEIAQLWHARILSEGRLSLPADPNPEFFAVDNIIDRPRWLSQFPIGGPALLALGILVETAWVLNPILTALLAWITYRFARRVYGEWQGRTAGVVVALSPMILIMGGTHMNHPSTALLVMLAFLAYANWRLDALHRTQRRWAAVLGASLGAALLVRPLDAVIAGGVLALAMLWSCRRDTQRSRTLPIAMLAAVIPVGLLLWANWRTTGDPLLFGYQALWGPNHSLGFHDDPLGNPHTPWRAMLLAVKYAAQLNWIATAWPIPAIALVVGGLISARTVNRWDVLLLSFVATQILAYAFYWHDGQFVGPRFVFSAVPALLILVARAPFLIAERAQSGVWWRIAILIVPVCLGVSWLRSMRPYGVQGLVAEFRETRTRLKIDPPAEAQRGTLRNALVFVQEGASSRLVHRLWGLGISRPDAARLVATADACSLVDAVTREELLGAQDTSRRQARIESSIRPFVRSSSTPRLPDPGFRVSDSTSIRDACAREVAHDYRIRNTVAFGPMLLRNQIDESGRIGGDVVYALDLGERNEVLRERFADRTWYRYEVPRGQAGTDPVLLRYDAVTADSAQSVRKRSP